MSKQDFVRTAAGLGFLLSYLLPAWSQSGPIVIPGQHGVSIPVRDMPIDTPGAAHRPHIDPVPLSPPGGWPVHVDPVVQGSLPNGRSRGNGSTFVGIAQTGVDPPDPNGAVGATQYVQAVNSSYEVFDKQTGAVLKGPVDENTFFARVGGRCADSSGGDAIVLYDKLANRWILSNFATDANGLPHYQCIAVSQTADATGQFNEYSFTFQNANDYPKIGVWPDGYYASYVMRDNNFTNLGGLACAYDRNAMMNNSPTVPVCLPNSLNPANWGFLPSDLDGNNPPPSGSPNYYVSLGTDGASLNLWKFHVDFVNTNNSTFTGPTNIPVDPFTAHCGDWRTAPAAHYGSLVPQLGITDQLLDTLDDRLMFRLAYRNFGDHESLVTNHTVCVSTVAGTVAGTRWYELRNPSNPIKYQSSTFAPSDGYHRWMGSIAMDRVGDMALGYSKSSGNIHPKITYTGRLFGDPLNQLPVTETDIYQGPASVDAWRWGDYSAMTVDPADDCTFWYTNEYYVGSQSWQWSTAIGNFSFLGCPVPASQSLSGITVSSGSGLYKAGTSITATNFNITGDASLTLRAGNTIYLEPYFQATAGSAAVTFHAVIGQ